MQLSCLPKPRGLRLVSRFMRETKHARRERLPPQSEQTKTQRNCAAAVGRLEAEAGHVCGPGLAPPAPNSRAPAATVGGRTAEGISVAPGSSPTFAVPIGDFAPTWTPRNGRLHGDDVKVLRVGGPRVPHGTAQPWGAGSQGR